MYNSKILKIVFLSIVTLTILCNNIYPNENTQSASSKIKSIEGVYKYRFVNEYADGEKYESEDIVEIVGYSPDAIYFRVELKFANAHSCGIYGIAKYSEGSFIYKEKHGAISGSACTVKISADAKELKITDAIDENSASTCSYHCGARGSLGNYKIDIKKKRKIRYLPIIFESNQYKAAVDKYNEFPTN